MTSLQFLRQHRRSIFMDSLLAFTGVMDVLVTAIILDMGGVEANPIANEILMANGIQGLVVFKGLSFLFILMGIHWIAYCNASKAQKLHVTLVAIWSFPPLFGLAQLGLRHVGMI